MKMKKMFVAIMLVCVAALGLAACGSDASSDSSSESVANRDENGNMIYVGESSYTVYPNELPCGVDYNGEELVLESADFFEQRNNGTGNDYQFFAVVKLDVSKLDEEHLTQLQQGVNLGVNVYITSEENVYDFDGMTELGHVYLADSKELLYGFVNILGHQDKYSFSGSSASVTINVREDGDDDGITLSTIMYRTTVPDSLPDESGMDTSTHNYMIQWADDMLSQVAK